TAPESGCGAYWTSYRGPLLSNQKRRRLNRPRWAGLGLGKDGLLHQVGPHLIAGRLDAVDPLLLGEAARDQGVDGIKEDGADLDAGDGGEGGEVAHGSLGAVVVDGVEQLVVALQAIGDAQDR